MHFEDQSLCKKKKERKRKRRKEKEKKKKIGKETKEEGK